MKVDSVEVSNGGILLSGGTGVFGVDEKMNALSCGPFRTLPFEHRRYAVSFRYLGQTFRRRMACMLAGPTSVFVGLRTEDDPEEELKSGPGLDPAARSIRRRRADVPWCAAEPRP